ncbi:DNA translocase FtsK 4TM domain-containing protein [Paenibacillus polygoni]|uniref:DNA translocase FtsK 4TM domain-containing protein n=1 Tax=Paenibacillus polygoni TaxID=3050112 RepID=A0ABY8X6T1_9BACL|nr:DNA translocase FtsK [Paenibacillus polygoni]WIV20839.1 DNA translocase FtsK 4TM domain-containing protein [Paenibacillus polygoni]
MARKKKKKRKSTLGGVLKYEIYGIILITLSVIALSGEATVGRSLSKMFGLLLGKFYFVIPLIGIFYGLMVMIHRKWPASWNLRKSGLVLLVLALTLMSTISAMEQKLGPMNLLNASEVMNQIHIDLQTELLRADETSNASMLGRDISGGYIGAVEYAVLLWLFGNMGANLMMIVMFFISFMLITGLSYVDLIRIFKTRVLRSGRALATKWKASAKSGNSRKTSTKNKAKPKPKVIPYHDDEEEEDQYTEDLPSRKAPLFFQLFGNAKSKQHSDGDSDLDPYQEDGQEVVYGAASSNTNLPWAEVYSENGNSLPKDPEVKSGGAATSAPIIRDFFENVRNENAAEEDDLDDAYPPEENLAVSSNAVEEPDLEAAQSGGLSKVDSRTAEESEEGAIQQPAPPPKPYKLPPFKLLSRPSNSGKGGDQNDYKQTARKLEATLESFGVRAKVLEVVRGPAVTRYEIQPDIGVKVSRVVGLTDDIALALAAKDIRMEAPIPGKSAIGIEVPNGEVSVVTMREVMETTVFQEADSKLSIAFGRDISGQTIVGNLAKMPHLLVAGATGSGKSVCINGIITSILYKAKPDEVKFLMVDPKMVELNMYNGIPHLLAPVVTDPKRASLALKKIVVEMEKRYELFSKSGTRNVEGYNNLMKDNPAAVLPYIVVIVDELADLMMVAANDVEDAIARLAQMARAAGIHLIIATQRPSVDVITGVIKANIPSRIAFGVSSQVDSRTILDMGGAEKLLGRGDMLFMPVGSSKPVRVQGAFLSDQEVENIVSYVRDQAEAEYDESLVPEIDDTQQQTEEIQDELYDQAVQIIIEAKQASVSLLQRRMRVGYTRAARLIDSMEARGVIGPYEGSKPREVLISMEQFQANKISS